MRFSARLGIIHIYASKNSSNQIKSIGETKQPPDKHSHHLSTVAILSIKRRPRRRVVQLHTTPLLVRRVGERQFPASLGLGRRQPQTHEVPAGRRRRVVGVGRAAVQGVRVAEELDVADLEDHVQRQAHAGLLQHGGGVLLRVRQRRDDAGVAEAREGFHVVGVPFAVDARGLVGAGLFVEDGLAGVGFLADGDFALAVKVPDGLGEGLGDVGVLFL